MNDVDATDIAGSTARLARGAVGDDAVTDERAPLPGVCPSVDAGVPIEGRELPTFYTSNEQAFAATMRLYARPGQRVADVTWGHGSFWLNIPEGTYDLHASDVEAGIDMRALPYRDNSFDVVVIDPPYRYTPAKSNVLANYDKSYKFVASTPDITRVQGVITLYAAGMAEANRVLKRGGFCIVKCQDTVQDGRQYWTHNLLMAEAEAMGYGLKDLAVVATGVTPPPSRWKFQKHLRKTHSYFLVLRKDGAHPFGMVSSQKRNTAPQSAACGRCIDVDEPGLVSR